MSLPPEDKKNTLLQNIEPEELSQFLESLNLHYPSKYQITYLDKLRASTQSAVEAVPSQKAPS